MSQASGAHDAEHSEWHREGQPCAQMSAGPRITRTLHPAQLVAERAQCRTRRQDVLRNTMRKCHFVPLRPDPVAEFYVIGVIVGRYGNAADGIPRIAP